MDMKIYCYILCLCCVGWMSCKEEIDLQGGADGTTPKNSSQVDASCNLVGLEGEGSSSLSRGLIGQITTQALECNFLKIGQDVDGVSPENYTVPLFEKWEGATMVNSEVLSSADNTENIHFRSIVFYPTQTYNYYDHDNDETTDPVAGITRMVGWYPRTYNVPVGPEGKPAEGKFDAASSLTVVDGKECVEFKNMLDGETDVMMTDMREGRMQIANFKNNNSTDYDVQPYGHVFTDYMNPAKGYKYCNYFTFNHYLSAVRLYIKVEESDLSLIAWKNINDVVFVNQPSTVAISLPTKQSRGNGASSFVQGATSTLPIEGVQPQFGEAKAWSDPQNMSVIKTPLSSNPDYPEFSEVPSYPVEMKQAISMDKTYLGYMLIQPGVETPIEIHTDAGVFNATIPTTVKVTENGQTTDKPILEQGCIYNIVIDMKANGTIDVVIGNENFESFKDLSPYNTSRKDFEFANSFIIDQQKMKKPNTEWYEGFYFHAMTAGRGMDGVINNPSDNLYPENVNFDPQKVRILWQSESALITHAELIHGYVRFVLNEKCRDTDNPMQGNAVLAVYDKEDNILWSWHIWVVNGVEDITYTIQEAGGGSDPRTIAVMNMNLGALKSQWTDGDDALSTYGLYYQWGRKDPSPGPPSSNYSISSLSTAEYYYMDQGTRNFVYRTIPQFPTTQDAILHPLDLIASANLGVTYSNDWLYRSVDYLWGGGTNGFTKKTIYDPCPYGYRVAYDELKLIFENAKSNRQYYSEETYGFVFKNGSSWNYFPFAGWKGHDRGRTDDTHAWYEVGNLGDYQDARISDGTGTNGSYYENHRGRSFLIKNDKFENNVYKVLNVSPEYRDQITLDYANRISASPVRCVRYNGIGEEPPNDNP